MTLPIDSLLPDVVRAAASGAVVIQAAPGAGKTTRVPTALLDAGLAANRQIVVLEPRRIAARAAAEFVAAQRGGVVGDEVGYRVRFEKRGSAATKLWFVSEGNFTRQLGRDPFLEDVGAVVLDEFHERHLQADLALAALMSLRASVRPDLKLVVMSATLEAERIAAHLGAELIRSQGRAHPVTIDYRSGDERQPLPHRIAAALRDGVDGGDVLVFLPGAREIRRTAEVIADWATTNDFDVVPLHGDLPLADQYRAIQPGPRRRVILSTNVAETALTVEGVTVVIDSGLARVARFDGKHGINHIAIARISRASADQRAGRAGRVRPGRCLRLWSESDQAGRVAHDAPEIRRLDLSEVLLELRAWGLARADDLPWLDPPQPSSWRKAERLLDLLGAVGEDGSLTDIGRRLLRLSIPPRLARMLVEAERRGCYERAAVVAALASERDICSEARALRAPGPASASFAHSSDLLLRLDFFEEAQAADFGAERCRALGLDVGAVRAVERTRRSLSRDRRTTSQATAARKGAARDEDEILRRCILAGFPDRVVRRRAAGSSRGLMVGNKGVVIAPTSAVRDAELLVAVEIDSGGDRQLGEARVRIASAIEREWLAEMFPGALRQRLQVAFDDQRESVIERRTLEFRDLVLAEEILGSGHDPSESARVLAEAARSDPERALQPSAASQALLDRIAAAQRWLPELGLPTPDALLSGAIEQLSHGRRSFADLRRADLGAALRQQLTGAQWPTIERELPAELALPNGRRTAIRYERDRPPVVAARIQELFGLASTPTLARNRVAVVIELLAPNQRPVQITDDLGSFWRTTYADIRKQLRGRYPKHAWPEDPWSMPPQRGARRR